MQVASLLEAVAVSGEGMPVRLLQQRLVALGYEVGPIDGVLGASTKEAIRQFQRSNDLEVTGEVNAALAMALFADNDPAGAE